MILANLLENLRGQLRGVILIVMRHKLFTNCMPLAVSVVEDFVLHFSLLVGLCFSVSLLETFASVSLYSMSVEQLPFLSATGSRSSYGGRNDRRSRTFVNNKITHINGSCIFSTDYICSVSRKHFFSPFLNIQCV